MAMLMRSDVHRKVLFQVLRRKMLFLVLRATSFFSEIVAIEFIHAMMLILENDINTPPVPLCHDLDFIDPITQRVPLLNPNDFQIDNVEEKKNDFLSVKKELEFVLFCKVKTKFEGWSDDVPASY
ncbi:hypothetical protein Tco_0219276 [Tanacetum coccineum]